MNQFTLHTSIGEITAASWNALAGDDPFAQHAFFAALENSTSIGAGTGWRPYYLGARDTKGQLTGAMALFVKTHSQGEYVFDHGFADAFARAGGEYYPKLLAAAPFTPINGRRILGAADGLLEQALLIGEQNGLSSLHINFATDQIDADGFIERLGVQYHFLNPGYRDFDDFLANLSASKRKIIKRERREAASGLEIVTKTGAALDDADWDCFWACYQDTGARKWGTPYLTRAFFDEIATTMAAQIVMVMAYHAGRPVAAALNFRDNTRLLGRYWGSLIDQRFLHFELAYYQAIDFAIENKIALVEAGAQGEHKIARGYRPVFVRSYHHFYHPGLHEAVANYVHAEREDLEHYRHAASQALPYKSCE